MAAPRCWVNLPLVQTPRGTGSARSVSLSLQHDKRIAQGSFLYLSESKCLPPANEVWGKVIFPVACVKNSVHGGVPGQVPPRQVHPPGRYTPWAGTPSPSGRYPLGRYTSPGQVHPTVSSVCWEIWATSGRYASNWNVFLFL